MKNLLFTIKCCSFCNKKKKLYRDTFKKDEICICNCKLMICLTVFVCIISHTLTHIYTYTRKLCIYIFKKYKNIYIYICK